LQKFRAFDELDKQLGLIQPAGPTALLSPIKQAMTDLVKTKADRKHIILLSDGASTSGETIVDAGKIAEELAGANITISTIATGEQIDEPFLKSISRNEKNGRFYRVSDFLKLKDFLKTDLSFYKELYYEEKKLLPRINDKTDWIKSINGLPFLNGYNRTSLKDRSNLCVSMRNNDPLLTEWYYGKGKVIAFTSSLDTDWGTDWLKWTQLGEFWHLVLHQISPIKKDDKNLTVSVTFSDNQSLKLEVTSLDNQYDLKLTAEIKKQAETIFSKPIPQVSPARYELIITGLNEGSYVICIYKNDELIKTVSFIIPYSQEWRRFGINQSLLEEIARTTDGKLLINLGQQQRIPESGQNNLTIKPVEFGLSYQDRDILLILIALGLLLFDLLINSRIFRLFS